MHLLTYSFLEDSREFPAAVMNPLDYRMEVFANHEDALRKARYVASHSRIYNLKIHRIEAEMGDAEIREWVAANPDAGLDFASEAGHAPSPIVSQSDRPR